MPELPFPDPPLGTDQITLRPWSASDLPAVIAACQDPDIVRFITDIPHPYGDADARNWLAQQEPARLAGRGVDLAIADREGRVLGAVGMSLRGDHRSADVGYWLAPASRRHGYASIALSLLCDWLFSELSVERIELTTDHENIASQRVAARAGFRQEGYLHAHLRFERNGERRDAVLWALLADSVRPASRFGTDGPRVIWLNGAFGAGKSSTATELKCRRPDLTVFDPELVGFILREFVDVPSGDFQDLPEWREVVAGTAASLARHRPGPILAPMTVWRPDYLLEIFSLVRSAGVSLVHTLIDAPDAVLAARIDGDPNQPAEAAAFRRARLVDYSGARTWLRTSADMVIDSAGESVVAVADRLEPLLWPDPRSRGTLSTHT